MNRLECSCMGSRNKMALKLALVSEKARLSERIFAEKEYIGKVKQSEVSGKHIIIGDSEKYIDSMESDLLHIKNLINQVSNIEVCGD